MRKDMKYRHNVLSNKKEFPLNKEKIKPRNDQKLLTIHNKLLILNDFSANVEAIENLLLLGGTKKQTLTEQDLVKVINSVLTSDSDLKLKSSKFDQW